MHLTGLVIMPIMASGQASATAVTRSRTMEALVLNKSSLVIPMDRRTEFPKVKLSSNSSSHSNHSSILIVSSINILNVHSESTSKLSLKYWQQQNKIKFCGTVYTIKLLLNALTIFFDLCLFHLS